MRWFFLCGITIHAFPGPRLNQQQQCWCFLWKSGGCHRKDTTRSTGSTTIRKSAQQNYLLDKNGPFIPVLFENKELLIIDKPAGIAHHNDDDALGIVNQLRLQQEAFTQRKPNSNNATTRIYGIHRLDRVTSGILVLAKDRSVAQDLARAFSNHTIVKYYTGLSNHKAKKKQGWVTGYMERSRRKSWKLLPSSNKNAAVNHSGQFAKTRFFTASLGDVTERPNEKTCPPRTLVLFQPLTGKTHQIRVAAKSLGLALTGDPIYRDGTSLHPEQRTCLHATAIYIPQSVSTRFQSDICVYSPPPFLAPTVQDKLKQLLYKHCQVEPLNATIHDYYTHNKMPPQSDT